MTASELRPVLLWGATGQALVLAEFAPAIGYRIVALVDRNPELESPLDDVPLLRGREGLREWLARRPRPETLGFLVAIGGDGGGDRLEISAELEALGLRPVSAVHPAAYVASDVRAGAGLQVMAGAVVGARAELGDQVIVNTGAVVDHECRLSHGVHVGPGARLAGCVEVGERAFIGTGAVVLPRVAIGRDAVIGAGAVVTRDVPAGVVSVGSPAKSTRSASKGGASGMGETGKFEAEVRENVARLGESQDLLALGLDFVGRTAPFRYTYNFSWLGRPIIQLPQDMLATQEIIWRIRPDLVIETGIAHGGSLVFYASLLELLGRGRVLGIDVDIRPHNRRAIEAHPMAPRIDLIQGSSLDPDVYEQVRARAAEAETVLVALDSNHTHDHVLEELRLYAPLVTPGSYCVVFDTVIEDMPPSSFPDRPWGIGNNPKTAVREFLKTTDAFEIDASIQHKLLITVAPDGYLRRRNA